jgi:hypothetical protein
MAPHQTFPTNSRVEPLPTPRGPSRAGSTVGHRPKAGDPRRPTFHPTNWRQGDASRRNRAYDSSRRTCFDAWPTMWATGVKGLLIRRFWVRIPGGAHTLSWEDESFSCSSERAQPIRHPTKPRQLGGREQTRRTADRAGRVQTDRGAPRGRTSTENRSARSAGPRRPRQPTDWGSAGWGACGGTRQRRCRTLTNAGNSMLIGRRATRC